MAESQLRKGAVEIIVLGLLRKQPSYGGQLIERMRDETGLEVSSGTLYPLLYRLKNAGVVSTGWEESPAGPPRKVYTLTDAGLTRLTQLSAEWGALANAVQRATTQKGPQQ